MPAYPFLTSDNYPSVRRVIDPGLDAAGLPDDVITDDIFLGRAATRVVALVPDAATRTGADALGVVRATVLLTAGYLMRAGRTVIRERFPDYEVAFADDADRAAATIADAEAILDTLNDAGDEDWLPGLRLGGRRRGW
jgi:hypothetical protein